MRRERGQFSGHRVPRCSKAFADTLRRRNPPLHAPRLSFSVRRDRVVDVDPGLRAWRGGAAARGPRGICQQPVLARGARDDVCAAKRRHDGPCWRCCGSNRRPRRRRRRTRLRLPLRRPSMQPTIAAPSRAAPAAAPPAETGQVAALKPEATQRRRPRSPKLPLPKARRQARQPRRRPRRPPRLTRQRSRRRRRDQDRINRAGRRRRRQVVAGERCCPGRLRTGCIRTDERRRFRRRPMPPRRKSPRSAARRSAIETPTVTAAKADAPTSRTERHQEAPAGAARGPPPQDRRAARGRRNWRSSSPPPNRLRSRWLNRRRAARQLNSAHAGPVATGGPSGRPHSAHEPSYSALPRTPSR